MVIESKRHHKYSTANDRGCNDIASTAGQMTDKHNEYSGRHEWKSTATKHICMTAPEKSITAEHVAGD